MTKPPSFAELLEMYAKPRTFAAGMTAAACVAWLEPTAEEFERELQEPPAEPPTREQLEQLNQILCARRPWGQQ